MNYIVVQNVYHLSKKSEYNTGFLIKFGNANYGYYCSDIKDLDGEIWKDVPNYPYQASNFGRIRSLNMNLLGRNNTYRIKKGIILKQSFDKDGYLRVALKGDTKNLIE